MSPGLLDAPALAHAYRFLVLWFGVQLLVSLASVVVQMAALTGALEMVIRCVSTIVRQPLLAFSESSRGPWPARAA